MDKERAIAHAYVEPSRLGMDKLNRLLYIVDTLWVEHTGIGKYALPSIGGEGEIEAEEPALEDDGSNELCVLGYIV